MLKWQYLCNRQLKFRLYQVFLLKIADVVYAITKDSKKSRFNRKGLFIFIFTGADAHHVFDAMLLCCFHRHIRTPNSYHWRELPQVSFLSRQKFCRDKIMFVATNICRDKNIFCHNKHDFVATSVLLSRQAYFVATNTCFEKLSAARKTVSG